MFLSPLVPYNNKKNSQFKLRSLLTEISFYPGSVLGRSQEVNKGPLLKVVLPGKMNSERQGCLQATIC